MLVEDYAAKYSALSAIKDDSLVILLDADGTVAPNAAAYLVQAGLVQEKIFYVKGGATSWLV